MAACGDEEILLPATNPIDGTWQFDGIVSNIDSDARCRLSGSMTVTQSGRFLEGAGETILTCDIFGTPETFEASGSLGSSPTNPRGLSENGNLSFGLGLCGMKGFHSDGLIEGTMGCVFTTAETGQVGTIGFWRAVRAGS